LTWIVTGELDVDCETVELSGYLMVQKGPAAVIRGYFADFDSDPRSRAGYQILWSNADAPSLIRPGRVARALSYVAKSQGGRLFIPRRAWDETRSGVYLSVDEEGALILPG
jgi:hypothetical protein